MRRGRGYEVIEGDDDAAAASSTAGTAPAAAAAAAAGASHADGGESGEGHLSLKILDVQGTTYELRLPPGATIGQLKTQLQVESGVETDRQRVIFMGHVLGDAESLAAAKVQQGSVLHLFQRPKTAPLPPASFQQGGPGGVAPAGASAAAGANGSVALQSHPELPSLVVGLVLPFQYSQREWALEQARRGMRLLAYCLLLISTMQVLQALAYLSADDLAQDAADATGSGYDETAGCSVQGPVYWMLVRSGLGIVVGVLGVRASHGMDAAAVRMYQLGLAVTAVLAIGVRFDILALAVSGQLQQCRCGPADSSTTGAGETVSDGGLSSTSFMPMGRGQRCHAQDVAERTTSDIVIITLAQVVLPAAVWAWCIVRARQYGAEIVRAAQEEGAAAAAEQAAAQQQQAAEAGESAAAGGTTAATAAVPLVSPEAVAPAHSVGTRSQPPVQAFAA